MKIQFKCLIVMLALFPLASFNLQFSTAFGQGALTPPGPPTPTMKSLDQIEPRTPISSLPFYITNAGSFFFTTNLTGTANTNGITVTADNVTLNLNGFVLSGGGPSGNGIHVPGTVVNLTICNGIIGNWGGHGISATNAAYGQFTGLKMYDNSADGMSVGNAIVTQCIAIGNNGIGILTGGNSTIKDCVAQANGGGGINGSGVIADCVASSNGSGVGITAGTGTVIRNCSVQNNGGGGIATAASCQVENCTVDFNNGIGISSRYSTISDCTVLANSGDGIQIFNYSVVTKNLCQSDGTGVHVTGQYNRVEDNHAMYNLNAGIKVDANNNIIIKNSASANITTNYAIAANNLVGPGIGFLGMTTNNNPNANFDY